ncbi:MAG: VPLPA-CTERM sorting domain-containing protein [Marinicaulis sp.]|nr:VPLPA-CTERM sorting domain-containing protein [Marinicaulis sp.]NNL90482.1 VPLPA-CTERM sorting domain-containing protein [Marinicaulis sp.]
MKKLLTAAAVAGAMAFAPAQAGLVSFAGFAASNGEEGFASGTSLTIDGVSMTFTSTHNPYFDGVSGGKPAGLGVCRDLTMAAQPQCVIGSDDSIDEDVAGDPESITITFDDGALPVQGISFRDGAHNLINDSTDFLVYSIVTDSGVLADTDTFANVFALINAGINGVESLTFAFASKGGDQFYIEFIETPIPAALPLLLSGIAGLGFASRRKKTA